MYSNASRLIDVALPPRMTRYTLSSCITLQRTTLFDEDVVHLGSWFSQANWHQGQLRRFSVEESDLVGWTVTIGTPDEQHLR
jgi:hypothetical protein